MAAMVAVSRREGDSYRVEVSERGTTTTHDVVCTAEHLRRFAGAAAVPAERLVEESFRFLLEREPKESILRRFELPVIASYFPDFDAEIRSRLA